MRFGLLSDWVGQRSGVPHIKLPQGLVNEESSFVHYWRNAVRRVPGRVAAFDGVQTPDANPILRYHYHRSTAGIDYVFVFTKAHAYLWSGSAWTLMFTCAKDCDGWSTENFGEYVVATNDLDKVQYWSDATPTVAFANVGGANGINYDGNHYLTRAKLVIRHWHYLHLLSTTEDGTAYKNFDRWCSAGDLTDWNENGEGDTDYRELGPGDEIVGAGIYNVQGANQLIVFTQQTVNAAWLVTDDLVYESQDILTGTGCPAPDSIVNAPDGQLYYISSDDDGAKEVRRVYDPNPLSYDVQATLDRMHPTLCNKIAASYIGQFQEIWWCIPSSGSSTGNDVVLPFSLMTQTWQPNSPMDICAFGYWTQQTTTYIDEVAEMIDDVIKVVDFYGPVAGQPISLVSDYSGYSWSTGSGTTDKEVSYMGQLVLSTDLDPDTLNRFKRLHGAWLYFLAHTGASHTVTVSIRRGESASYVNKGNVSLDGNGQTVRKWLRFDGRTRNLDLKLSASNDFEFLGVIFDYDLCGERA